MFLRRSSILATMAITAGVGSCLQGHAHDEDKSHTHTVRAVKPAEMYMPTPIPDRIILTWAGDPKTTQAVTWRTSVEVADAYAELAIAGSGPNFVTTAETIKASSTALKTDLNTAHFHSVQFKGLKPGTKYAYRVGDKTNWSEWFHFSTEKDSPEPFSFIYFGDAQNDLRSMWSRVVRESHSDAPKAKFIIHAGDLINKAQSDGEWGEWFGAGSWLNASDRRQCANRCQQCRFHNRNGLCGLSERSEDVQLNTQLDHEACGRRYATLPSGSDRWRQVALRIPHGDWRFV